MTKGQAFQADDERSIPVTRSNDFKGLCAHRLTGSPAHRSVIPTSGLLVILTNACRLFA
jgi:hypothetical protein